MTIPNRAHYDGEGNRGQPPHKVQHRHTVPVLKVLCESAAAVFAPEGNCSLLPGGVVSRRSVDAD